MPALIQAPGVIDADSCFQSRPRDGLFQIGMDSQRSLVRTCPASRAYEDVNFEGPYLHFHWPITLDFWPMANPRREQFALIMNHHQEAIGYEQ
jgi:hypothetical protein